MGDTRNHPAIDLSLIRVRRCCWAHTHRQAHTTINDSSSTQIFKGKAGRFVPLCHNIAKPRRHCKSAQCQRIGRRRGLAESVGVSPTGDLVSNGISPTGESPTGGLLMSRQAIRRNRTARRIRPKKRSKTKSRTAAASDLCMLKLRAITRCCQSKNRAPLRSGRH